MNYKLMEIKVVNKKIILESNLHIGSGNTDIHIGGIDNPIIKHPHTLEPYIPGSSLKGKVRSLMELSTGISQESFKFRSRDGGIATYSLYQSTQDQNIREEIEAILKIFGFSGSEKREKAIEFGATRVSFSDCFLNADWKKNALDNYHSFTAEKSENSINRITGTADKPRQTEMVPAGAVFDFKMTFKIFCDEDQKLFEKLKKGLELLEKDALGGYGSRGYGRIRFEDLVEN